MALNQFFTYLLIIFVSVFQIIITALMLSTEVWSSRCP